MKNSSIPLFIRKQSEPHPIVGNITGATWSTDGDGYIYNTPTVGSEILSNGNMETGSPPTSWTAGGSGVLTTVADERTGGSGSAAINVRNNSTNFGRATQGFTATVEMWYRVAGWMKTISAISSGITVHAGGFVKKFEVLTNTPDWSYGLATGPADTTSLNVSLVNGDSTNGVQSRYDDVSLKLITYSTMFASVDTSESGLNISVSIIDRLGSTQCGVVSHLDSAVTPANYIHGYIYGDSTIRLDKVVSGVRTSLINISNTFVPSARISIVRLPSNIFQLWYNNIQIGTNQTINDASIIDNTIYGIFSTDLENKLDRLYIDNDQYTL